MTDLEWCRSMLPRVSRTFAMGIQMLPQPFEPWVTVGYLLCRVVDTVEDTESIEWDTRRRLFTAFEKALTTGDCTDFEADADAFEDNADGELSRDLRRIIDPMLTFPKPIQAAMRKWIGEMSGGMALYARRHASGSGSTTLHDLSDLERYCYYVAGTVGHLLTDVFLIGAPQTQANARRLRQHAEGFGLLLQMTNIVKDVTDDAKRGWCFIPETACEDQQLTSQQLLDPAHSAAAVRAVDTVNKNARRFFAEAVSYVVALPKQSEGLRRFCLFPMLLAAKTLDLALGNTAVVDPSRAVKVSREIVAETAQLVESILVDDRAIAALTMSTPAEA